MRNSQSLYLPGDYSSAVISRAKTYSTCQTLRNNGHPHSLCSPITETDPTLQDPMVTIEMNGINERKTVGQVCQENGFSPVAFGLTDANEIEQCMEGF